MRGAVPDRSWSCSPSPRPHVRSRRAARFAGPPRKGDAPYTRLPLPRTLAEHQSSALLLAATAGAPCLWWAACCAISPSGCAVHDVDVVGLRPGPRGRPRPSRGGALSLVHPSGGARSSAPIAWFGGEDGVDLWDREGMSVEEDLARRDFTVNAFAWDRAKRRGARPERSRADLERRLLKATTAESFTGDPLRLLRLPRPAAAAARPVSVDPRTVELARRSARAPPGRGAPSASATSWRSSSRSPTTAVASSCWRRSISTQAIWARPSGRARTGRERARGLGMARRFGRSGGELGGAGSAGLLAGGIPTTACEALAWRFLFAGRALTPGPSLAAAERGNVRSVRWRWRVAAVGVFDRREARWRWCCCAESCRRARSRERWFLFRIGEDLWAAALCARGAQAGLAGAGSDGGRSRRRSPVGRKTAGRALPSGPRLLSGLDVQEIAGLPPAAALGRILPSSRPRQGRAAHHHREAAERWLRDGRRGNCRGLAGVPRFSQSC